jgi:hypothetical protein
MAGFETAPKCSVSERKREGGREGGRERGRERENEREIAQ